MLWSRKAPMGVKSVGFGLLLFKYFLNSVKTTAGVSVFERCTSNLEKLTKYGCFKHNINFLNV